MNGLINKWMQQIPEGVQDHFPGEVITEENEDRLRNILSERI